MKYFNSVTGQYEDDGKELAKPNLASDYYYTDMTNYPKKISEQNDLSMAENPEAYPFARMSDLSNLVSSVKPQEETPAQSTPKEMNPLVKQYLMSKIEPNTVPQSPEVNPYDNFSEEKYNQAVNQMKERQSNLGLAQLAAGFGDALARRNPANSDGYFKDLRNNIQDETVGEFNRKKKTALEDYNNKRNFDVNSDESKIAQSLAVKMGVNPEMAKRLTAAKFKELSPVLEKMYAVEEQKQMKNFLLNERNNEKREQKAKLSDKQIEAFTDLDNASSDLTNLVNQLGNKDNWAGPIDGRVPDMMVGADQVAWRSAVGKYKDAYRKAITGAGAGPSEIAILESRLPTENDSPANFKAKALEAQKELERRRNVMTSNLEKGGKNVELFKSGISTNPTNQNQSKPKSIKQNGHVYILNETTGEYE